MITHEEKIEISRRTLLLIRPAYFVARVTELAAETELSYKEAYHLIEKEYFMAFNQPKYSSYDTFRVIKSRLFYSENKNQLKLF